MAPSRASPPTSCGPPAEIAPEIASRDCAQDRSLPEARACGEVPRRPRLLASCASARGSGCRGCFAIREEKRGEQREKREKGIGGSSALRKVLCNADLPAAEEALLPPHLSRADKLRSAASSSSVLSLSFALDAQFADALAHHTIVFAEDLGQAPWESLFGARRTSSFLPVAAAPPWAPGHFYVRRPTRGVCSLRTGLSSRASA